MDVDQNDSGIGNPADFSGDLSKLLECFGADINKSVVAKRRRLEQYTQDTMKATTKRVFEMTETQATERRRLIGEFHKQLSNLIQQGETELEKAKDAEDRLQKLIQQQQKHQQQIRISQSQRLKILKQLGEQFFQGIEELEKRHIDQYSSVQVELRKEMALLQKKILMDTQQQEMINVKKSLQSMLM
ncbi:synaptonemal complex protein 3-like [Tachypleus tridentatus]|uniref:synaptonemal complex protein 3-like n=1 Tax=Tachypleus tridentatus TaxID=6853 RepID=UPI003FD3EF9E